jgi:hypothetical protein
MTTTINLSLETSNKPIKIGLNQWIKLRFYQPKKFEITNVYNIPRTIEIQP